MARCCGLCLLSEHDRNPLFTTSKGTGELIKVLFFLSLRFYLFIYLFIYLSNIFAFIYRNIVFVI